MDQARSIAEVVGVNLKGLRAEYGITLAELSRWLRYAMGLNWSTGRLADVESGRGSATVQLVAVLALAISDISGEKITPTWFMQSREPVVLSPIVTLRGSSFLSIMEGERSSISASEDMPDFAEREQEALKRLWNGIDPRVTTGVDSSTEAQWSLADERAAKKLGFTKEDYVQRCLHRWGMLLSAEVNRRTGPGDSPQKKGRLTRLLMEELKGSSDGDD